MKNHFLSCTAKQESVGFGFIRHCICTLLTSLKSVSQKCEARGLIFPLSYIHVNLKHSFVGADNGGNAECRTFVFLVQEARIVSQSNVLSLEEVVSQAIVPMYSEFLRAAVHRQVTGSGLMALQWQGSLGKRKRSLSLTTLLDGPFWSQPEPGLTIWRTSLFLCRHLLLLPPAIVDTAENQKCLF